MTILLQATRAAAYELVGRTRAWSNPVGDGGRDSYLQTSSTAVDRLLRSQRDFEYFLDRSYMDDEDAQEASVPSVFAPWLRALSEKRSSFREHVRVLQDLAARDPDRARAFLDEVLDPFLQDDVLPVVYAYRTEAEEAMADQLDAISAAAGTTTWVALGLSGVAVFLAAGLGALLWRSIHTPIRTLSAAAESLGQGHLDTRVEVASPDEFRLLADAFNNMAQDLATTTVSVDNLENVFDSMASALIILDRIGCITSVNGAALELLGYQRDELHGRPFHEICSAPAGRTSGATVRVTDDGIVAVEERELLRKDGTRIPVSFSGAELRPGDGPPEGYVCVAQDRTERRLIEERIRSSLAEKELLLREVHHRVKNNMQVISSLLAIQASYTDDPQTRAQFDQSQDRIRSMALIHDQLYLAADLAEVDVGAYLELLTTHLLQSFDSRERATIDLEVGSLSSDLDQAAACGLIVNELVTNSLKHAFPEGVTGKIRVSLSEDEAGNRILLVADDGCGLPDDLDIEASQTLGLTLVRALVKQYHGHLVLGREGGVEVRIIFPPFESELAAA